MQRSKGQSATGKAAYRSGENIIDERTGLSHDYTRKTGVDHCELIGFSGTRSELWNLAELAERRKDATTAREYEIALPIELDKNQKIAVAKEYGTWLHQQHKCAVDICLHDLDSDNPHAHILTTTRESLGDQLGDKIAREWSDTKRKKNGLNGRKEDLQKAREQWEEIANRHLELANEKSRIDHRSLEAQGIDRIPQIHLGAKVIEMEFKGRRTERGSRALKIEKTNAKIIDLQEYKKAIEHERTNEIKKSKERRRASNGDRTIGTSHSEFSRSDRNDFTESRTRNLETSRSMDPSARRDNTVMETSGDRIKGGRRSFDTSNGEREKNNTRMALEDMVRNLDSVNDAYDSSVDRVINLARLGNNNTRGNDVDLHYPKKPIDRTYLAVRRQLQAMDCDKYDIAIRDKHGRMMNRIWSSDEVLKSVDWLKRENAKGGDIYIRPDGEKNQGLILVDDLNGHEIKRMKKTGLEPATVVETSPMNYQAWVRLSEKPIKPEIATTASKGIAKHFNADINSADWRHYGRLSGFTNRKPEHTTETGRNPWVLCHESSGKKAIRGEEMLAKAERAYQERAAEHEKQTRLERVLTPLEDAKSKNPSHEYLKQIKRLREQYGADMDLSRADYMIAKDMLSKKHGYTQEQVKTAIEKNSPELPTRKLNHEQDYCNRTVENAFRFVIEQEKQRSQKTQHEIKRELERDFTLSR